MSTLITVEQFDGGIQPDVRSRTVGGCAMSKHFNHTNAPNKLVPRRDFESINDLDGVTDGIEAVEIKGLGFSDLNAFIDENGDYTGDVMVGVGKVSSGAGCKVVFFDVEDGTEWKSAYLDTGGVNVMESSSKYPHYGPVIEVDEYVFFPSGSSTSSGNEIGHIDQHTYPQVLDDDLGIFDGSRYWSDVRGPDGKYYISKWVQSSSSGTGNNCLYTLNEAGTVTEDVFCASGHTYVQGLCRNGNYVGLGVCDRTQGRQSHLEIWDTVNDDPLQVIPWGNGYFYWLEELNGDYVGITADNMMFTEYMENGTREMVLRVSSGGPPRFVTKFLAEALSVGNYCGNPHTWKHADEFYFYARVATNSGATEFEEGLWSVRKSSTGEYAMTLAYDTSSLEEVNIWHGVGDHCFFVHDSTHSVSRINTSESYTVTSVFETLYNPQMSSQDYFKEKTLEAFRIKCEPLPTAGQIVIKYRTNENSSWTTIATITTDDLITKEIVNIESTGAPLPDFKEIQFRIESTGGAVVTGYEYKYDEISDLVNG